MPRLDAISPATIAHGHALLDTAATQVEAWLDSWSGWASLPPALAEAGRYGVLNGGKRLRPALVLLACEAAGGARDAAMPAAAAVELVHCFSLVHDDLPALDDDALRRGKPTLHVTSGEAMAILAGDLLLAQAFQVLAEATWPADTCAAVTRLLADNTVAMVSGQVYDTLGGVPDDLDDTAELELIHRNKTGALIEASVGMGAAVAGSPDEALQDWGAAVGLMFQIVDDLLDVTQSEAAMGKATGKDAVKGRPNWPARIGIDAASTRVQQLLDEATAAAARLGDAGRDLSELAATLAVRTS